MRRNKALMLLLILSMCCCGIAAAEVQYFSFMNDSIEQLRNGEGEEDYFEFTAVNVSLASHHLKDPECDPNDNKYCQYAVTNGYNEFNPGVTVEFSLSKSAYLLGGFVYNSFSELSLVGGVGRKISISKEIDVGLEGGLLSNHVSSRYAAIYIQRKYIRIGYIPKFKNDSSDLIYLQLRIKK